jgi:hypothetical protein
MNFCGIFRGMQDYFSERLMDAMCDKSLNEAAREAVVKHYKVKYALSKQIFENALQIQGETRAGDTFKWLKLKAEPDG